MVLVQNVWGIWNGITPHDSEALRRVGTLLRYFGGTGGAYERGESFLQSPGFVITELCCIDCLYICVCVTLFLSLLCSVPLSGFLL